MYWPPMETLFEDTKYKVKFDLASKVELSFTVHVGACLGKVCILNVLTTYRKSTYMKKSYGDFGFHPKVKYNK